jgi:hypothetical protein
MSHRSNAISHHSTLNYRQQADATCSAIVYMAPLSSASSLQRKVQSVSCLSLHYWQLLMTGACLWHNFMSPKGGMAFFGGCLLLHRLVE